MKDMRMKKWLMFCLGMLCAAPALATEVAAVLQWSQRVELSLPVSGVVQAVNVEVGQRVKKGQALLTLDAQSLAARAAESRATVARHRAELAEATRDLERVQELYNRTVIATTELDQARLRHARAKGLFDEAQARLRQDSKALDDATLRAPFDAVVVARQAEPGQVVASGLKPPAVLVLAKAGEMLASFKLYDTQLERLKPGQAVTVEVAGKTYPGRIRTLGMEPLPNKDEALYPVAVLFQAQDVLRAGTPAKVRLP